MSGKILPLFLAYHQMVRQVKRALLRSLFGAVLGNRSSGGAITLRLFPLQNDIHPKYEAINASCSVGNLVGTP